MNVIRGKPVKAFIYQDHEAHIGVHIAAMQDPQVAQLMGQNPQAQAMMAAMQAHIAEHLAFSYRKQIEEAAGVPYPPPDAEMSEDTELEVSRLAAAAAKQVLQASQSKAAQQMAQQTAQDPIVQMQQQEIQIKQKSAELQEKKLMIDAAIADDKLDIERERIASQERIAGLQVGAKIATDKAGLSAKQQADGLRIGVDIARDTAQRDHELNRQTNDHHHQAAQAMVQQSIAQQAAAQEAEPQEGETESEI
jgi:hypothetical protein